MFLNDYYLLFAQFSRVHSLYFINNTFFYGFLDNTNLKLVSPFSCSRLWTFSLWEAGLRMQNPETPLCDKYSSKA